MLVITNPELDSRLEPARLSVEQYHRMIEAGILPEGAPIELLEGLLVLKDRRDSAEEGLMTVGHQHAIAIHKLQRLERRLPPGLCLRVQLPMTVADTASEPEPDGLIAIGEFDAFTDRHPTPADVWMAIEIAASSLADDLGSRKSLFASVGVPHYLVVDLHGRRLHHFSQPTAGEYVGEARLKDADFDLPLPDGATLAVSTRDFLP